MLPDSTPRFIWHVTTSFILLASLLWTPYILAFSAYHLTFKILDFIIDIIMLIDLVLHFFYAFANKRQKVVTDFRQIFWRYIFGTFFFDLISLTPYYFIPGGEHLQVLKLLRFVRIGGILSGISKAFSEGLLKLTPNINFARSLTRIIM